jgi:exocyst complex component 8
MKLYSMNQASMDSMGKRGPDKPNCAAEQREWRRKLHRTVDKLRDSFCRQHALDLIFTDEGGTHLSAEMYISMDSTVEEPEWIPSLIFQVRPPCKISQEALALCSLSSPIHRRNCIQNCISWQALLQTVVAADLFVGRERLATLLMMRLTETVILWLSEDQSFWEEIEEGPTPLGPLGLQQVWSCIFSFLYTAGSCS